MEQLYKEIVDIEKERLRNEIKQEIMEEEQKIKIKKIKAFLGESVFLAFILGLLVNQVTGLIDLIKREPIALYTFIIIVIISVGLFLFVIAIYIGKLEELFIKKK